MPTALELTREEWQPYLLAAQRQLAATATLSHDPQERRRLIRRAKEAAAILKERLGARRVVLFGSLAHSAWFTLDSDIDLAIEGVRPEDFWEAWRIVEDIVVDRPVDLVEIESARPSLVEAIHRYVLEL